MHKHLRGIPRSREVIILNLRVARISPAVGGYHFGVSRNITREADITFAKQKYHTAKPYSTL